VNSLRGVSSQSWAKVCAGLVIFEVDGWVITFLNTALRSTIIVLTQPLKIESAALRHGSVFGSHPLSVLSGSKHKQLERFEANSETFSLATNQEPALIDLLSLDQKKDHRVQVVIVMYGAGKPSNQR
jgi:hypothetical protein